MDTWRCGELQTLIFFKGRDHQHTCFVRGIYCVWYMVPEKYFCIFYSQKNAKALLSQHNLCWESDHVRLVITPKGSRAH